MWPDKSKPWGGDLHSWFWVIGMLLVGLAISGAALASKEFREELGADWGTVLLLTGAGALLTAMNETAKESRTRLLGWAVLIAGVFGFAGVFLILTVENPLILTVMVTLLICYFMAGVPAVPCARFGIGAFTQWRRRRTRNRDGGGACLWCYDTALPDDGLCRACWNWVQTGARL